MHPKGAISGLHVKIDQMDATNSEEVTGARDKENMQETMRLWKLGELGGKSMSWAFKFSAVFEAAGIPKGTILDVGSNNAHLARWFRKNHIAKDVISFDLRDLKLPGEQFVRGTVSALPFKDNAVETVVSFQALPIYRGQNLTDEEIMYEMLRVASRQVIIWPPPSRWIEGYSRDMDGQQIDNQLVVKASEMVGERARVNVIDQPSLNMVDPLENRIMIFEKSS